MKVLLFLMMLSSCTFAMERIVARLKKEKSQNSLNHIKEPEPKLIQRDKKEKPNIVYVTKDDLTVLEYHELK